MPVNPFSGKYEYRYGMAFDTATLNAIEVPFILIDDMGMTSSRGFQGWARIAITGLRFVESEGVMR